MAILNSRDYTIEFKRNYGLGYGRYTWFLSRSNYSREHRKWTSDSVWVYTTDYATEYDAIRLMSKTDAIRYIKRNRTEFYKSIY